MIKKQKQMELIVLCFLGFWFLLVTGATDPCDTTHFLNDDRRSVAETTNHNFCDNILEENWYRILSGSGTKMPTVCPTGYARCGTTDPIWLSNDTLSDGEDIYPAVGETVNRIAYQSNFLGCRIRDFAIQIKNCDSYYVYYLLPTRGCPASYCFGDQLPCPDRESSETGFTPDCGPYPEVEVFPYVTTQLEETQGYMNGKDLTFSRATFQCHAEDLLDDNVYEIRWYISEFEIAAGKSNNLTKNEVENGNGKMLEEHWTLLFSPNFIVKCSIKVRGFNYKAPGPEQYSQPFFAGIKIDQTEYIINENEGISIPVELTMPLSCSWPTQFDKSEIDGIKQNKCVLNLLNGVPNYQTDGSYCKNGISDEGLVFTSKKCGIVFNHANWTETQYVDITGPSNGQINSEDGIVYLRLYNDPDRVLPQSSLKVWTGIHLIDIKVVIHDTDEATLGKECYAQNDPHMRTFGQRKYELQNVKGVTAGEYIMYEHKTLPLQVNAFFKRCKSGSNALCNCGVAVRSGDSLFVTNFCETELTNGERRTNNYIIQRLCDDQNLIVEETGDKFKIILPTGTKVLFSHTTSNDGKHTIQQISIFPSSLDLDMTSGLCGSYTGKTDDSLKPRNQLIASDAVTFVKSWKVENDIQDLTLFDSEGKLKPTEYSVPQFCTCQLPDEHYPHKSADFDCNLSAAMKTCRSKKTLKSVYTTSCKNRVYFSKRSVGRSITKSTDETEEDDDKPTMYPMTSESSVDESNQIESDWSNGWTNDTARQFCTESIYNTPAFGPCSQYVPFMDPEAYIENCILDIKYEGNSTWIKSTLEGFADVCLEKAQKLENLTKTNDTTSSGAEKSIFDLISESTCADNCSGHGQCLEGVCNCTTGYFGSSCSSDASQPPLLIRNAFEGECDTAKKPCKKFIIPGSNFIDDGNLTCRFESFRILKNTSSSTVVWDETFMYPGKFRSSFFMNCELPETRRKRSTDDQKNVEGYDVSVSNNGLVFTEPLTIIVFDSLCFKCNLTELQCDELDTCPGLKEEPTTPKDSISIFLVISLAISISIIMLIVGLLCLKKKLRTRQQEPYVGDMKTMAKNHI